MWPLLIVSIVSLSVVIERLIFIVHERSRRQEGVVIDAPVRFTLTQ